MDRWPCVNHPTRRALYVKGGQLLCDQCADREGGLAYFITPKLIASMPSLFPAARR